MSDKVDSNMFSFDLREIDTLHDTVEEPSCQIWRIHTNNNSWVRLLVS